MLALSINLVDGLKELRERTFNPEKKPDTESDEVKSVVLSLGQQLTPAQVRPKRSSCNCITT